MRAHIQAVLFDLDGTLLDRRRSFERFARNQWERFAGALTPVDADDYVRTLVRLDGDGYGPRRDLFTGLTTRFELASDLADKLLAD